MEPQCARSSVDRVLASEAKGRWFDSSRARHHVLSARTFPQFSVFNTDGHNTSVCLLTHA